MSATLYGTAILHRMVKYNARAEIMGSVGDVSSLELLGTQLIVAPYVQSGIPWSDRLGMPFEEALSVDALCDLYASGKGFLAQQYSTESIYQGKVAMVLRIGGGVDVEDPTGSGTKLAAPLAVGDWIVSLQENTRGVSIHFPGAKQSRVLKALGVDYTGYPCKFLYGSDVYARIPDPDMVV